jgi:hypothetical protein
MVDGPQLRYGFVPFVLVAVEVLQIPLVSLSTGLEDI